MQSAYEVIKILKDGKFHSGNHLAEKLGVSRTAIWKAIDHLRKLDVEVDAVNGKGYRIQDGCELLDKDRIQSLLTPQSLTQLHQIETVGSIDSTNDYLLNRIRLGLHKGSIVIAEGQTKGRGRMGKNWYSPFAANVYFSLYWPISKPAGQLTSLPIVVGLSVIEAIAQLIELPAYCGFKWPNDIWVGDSKLCGILVESTQNHEAPQNTHIVIGVGVNIKPNMHSKTKEASISLQECTNQKISRNVFCAQLIDNTFGNLTQFEQEGFAPFLAKWQQYDLLFGREIHFFDPGKNEYHTGLAKGINERGELLIDVEGQMIAIQSGKYSVRPL